MRFNAKENTVVWISSIRSSPPPNSTCDISNNVLITDGKKVSLGCVRYREKEDWVDEAEILEKKNGQPVVKFWATLPVLPKQK